MITIRLGFVLLILLAILEHKVTCHVFESDPGDTFSVSVDSDPVSHLAKTQTRNVVGDQDMFDRVKRWGFRRSNGRFVSKFVPKPTKKIRKPFWKVAKPTKKIPKPFWKVAKPTKKIPKPFWKVAKPTKKIPIAKPTKKIPIPKPTKTIPKPTKEIPIPKPTKSIPKRTTNSLKPYNPSKLVPQTSSKEAQIVNEFVSKLNIPGNNLNKQKFTRTFVDYIRKAASGSAPARKAIVSTLLTLLETGNQGASLVLTIKQILALTEAGDKNPTVAPKPQENELTSLLLMLNKTGQDCYNVVDGKAEYTGKLNVTSTGDTCQKWNSQKPHLHPWTDADLSPDTLVSAENYCRDPDKSGKPWCYTTKDEKQYEECAVSKCA